MVKLVRRRNTGDFWRAQAAGVKPLAVTVAVTFVLIFALVLIPPSVVSFEVKGVLVVLVGVLVVLPGLALMAQKIRKAVREADEDAESAP